MNVMTPQISQRLEQPITAALRALAMDAVEKAKSGHPGAPMGLAEVAAVLWRRHLRHNPRIPCGPTAIALCCRKVTPRCCSTRCCIFRAMICQ